MPIQGGDDWNVKWTTAKITVKTLMNNLYHLQALDMNLSLRNQLVLWSENAKCIYDHNWTKHVSPAR